jgi:hypothetical protein
MRGRKRLLRVIAVLLIAMATGHAVETLRATQPAATALAAEGAPPVLADLAGITPVAATAERPGDPCAPVLDLAAAPGAMIRLVLFAPCKVGERVLLRHSGLSFTAQIGLEGTLDLTLPALAEQALVAAYFEGSGAVLQSVTVSDAARHPRFAFQAAYPLQFDLRVEEAGHLYSGRGSGTAAGPIMTLGTSAVGQPILAQVYSFPGPDLTAVDLTVELRITPDTCSRSFVAETLVAEGGSVRVNLVPVAVPLCGTAGDILVLKNLVGTPTLLLPQ